MISTQELSNYIENVLDCSNISDYCPNGLQIERMGAIDTIVTGVTASKALIEKAINKNADAILVHHGYFWPNERQVITGMKYDRIQALIFNNIALYGYHLPLDIHPVLGNNVQLANLLHVNKIKSFDTGTAVKLGVIGDIKTPISLNKFSQKIQNIIHRDIITVQGHSENIKKIAICTGAAQDFIEHACNAGADTYISGEISERTTHIARELNINYICAGHHATERYGIKALGNHLATKFSLTHHFIDIDNPA